MPKRWGEQFLFLLWVMDISHHLGGLIVFGNDRNKKKVEQRRLDLGFLLSNKEGGP